MKVAGPMVFHIQQLGISSFIQDGGRGCTVHLTNSNSQFRDFERMLMRDMAGPGLCIEIRARYETETSGMTVKISGLWISVTLHTLIS